MMLDGYYRNRLTRDLESWQRQGWVDDRGAEAILKSVEPDRTASRLPTILGFLGAVLIVFAAMAFVAANWSEIPRIVRLTLLLGGMAVAYGCAWMLMRRDYRFAADAAILIGTGVYGAAIMLVAQIYHIEAHYPDGVLMWSLGATLAAALTLSRGAHAVAIAGASFWSMSEMLTFGWDVHWPFLPLWVLLTLIAVQLRWAPARHLTLIAILAWFVVAMGKLFERLSWAPWEALAVLMAATALVFAACHLARNHAERDGHGGSPYLEYAASARYYALFAMLALAFLTRLAGIEFTENTGMTGFLVWATIDMAIVIAAIGTAIAGKWRETLRTPDVIAIAAACIYTLLVAVAISQGMLDGNGLLLALADAAFVMLLAVWAIDYGQSHDSRPALNLGLTTFGIEILYLYFETFGSLLDTAFFFLTGGILLLALGWILNRLRTRLTVQEDVA